MRFNFFRNYDAKNKIKMSKSDTDINLIEIRKEELKRKIAYFRIKIREEELKTKLIEYSNSE